MSNPNKFLFAQEAQEAIATVKHIAEEHDIDAEVQRYMQRLETLVGSLENLLATLEKKIEPVLVPQDNEKGYAIGPTQAKAPLSVALSKIGDEVELIDARMRSLLYRIAL